MVVEGVSRSRNALINGDIKNYDWDSGYTCHQLGSGCIIVQLAQPYLLSSLRLAVFLPVICLTTGECLCSVYFTISCCRILLWDCDGRSYSFYVEVSNNMQKWTMVIDKTKEMCRSVILYTVLVLKHHSSMFLIFIDDICLHYVNII